MKTAAVYVTKDAIVRLIYGNESAMKVTVKELEKYIYPKYLKSKKKDKKFVDFLWDATRCMYDIWLSVKFDNEFKFSIDKKTLDFIWVLFTNFELALIKFGQEHNIPTVDLGDSLPIKRKGELIRIKVCEHTLIMNYTGFDLNFNIGAVDGHMRHAIYGSDKKKDDEYVSKFASWIFEAYDNFIELDKAWQKIGTILDDCPHLDYYDKIKNWMNKNSEKLKGYLTQNNHEEKTNMKQTIKSYKIKNGLFVNEVTVDMPVSKVDISVPQHQFIIIDRSGSMWGDLDDVCDTIIKYVDRLAEGSTVSVGWFSSRGEYGLSVPYTLKKEADGVKKTVNSYRRTLGCTCFTEVLNKVKENCKDTRNSLYFFTDGCHNEGAWSNVTSVLEELKDKLDVALFVGCGYIDRDNMTEMATITNGSFIHLSNFNEFEQSLFDFGDGVVESVPGCIVDVSDDQENICSVLGKQVISYSVKDGKITYKASNKKTQVYYCTSKKALGAETDLGKNEVPFRAMAYYLVQHNKTPVALDILNFIGEKFLINKLYNSFTNDEYAKAEQNIRSSIFYSKSRFKEGKVVGYLPKDNAFCVLDALDAITADDKAYVELSDKEFTYRKISRSADQTDGPAMILPKDIHSKADRLVYNEDALNVSLMCNYFGKVPLDPKAFKKTEAGKLNFTKYGLKKSDKYTVQCIRNYSIIADAKLNTPKLVLSGIGKKTVNKLAEIITARDDGKYVVDLSNIPLINKSYLKETSAKKLAEYCWDAKMLGTELSVLRYLLKEKLGDSKKVSKNADLEEVLQKCFYIKNDIYQPPKSLVEATDSYMHYEFRVTFKGYSAVQTSSVVKKIIAGKALTDREAPVQWAYEDFKGLTQSALEKLYDSKMKEYRSLNNKIQHAKFAIILINRGSMPEFDSRENMVTSIQANLNGACSDIEAKFEVVQKPVKL